ncbi:MAG: hypothetical protein Q7R35_16500 [Elusimicrobiota bacterium]|nr:hypothetical protein [Elusimicrobiota bacterium]
MGNRVFNLKPQMTTLRARSALPARLLLTAFYTAVILAAGLYGVRHWPAAPHEITQTEPQPEEPAALPEPEHAAFYPRAAAPGAASGSVAMVKAGKAPAEEPPESYRPAARAAAGKPRLRPATFGSSGGNFATQPRETTAPVYAPPAARARVSEREILLKPSDFTKKIKVKGARPVSAAGAKRYSGMDKESEMLRARRLAEIAAAKAAEELLLREKLKLVGLITFVVLAISLLGSRVIRALHLLDNPEGPHWTLK